MKSLRVGVDAHILDGKYQGSRTWLIELLKRAPRMAPDITFVVYSNNATGTARLIDFAKVEHRPLPAASPVGRNILWPRSVRRDQLSLLVTQYFCSPRISSIQVPVIHDVLYETHPEFFPWRYRWRNRLLVSWSARRSRLVITVSEYSRKKIVQLYRLDPDKVAIVSNGVDTSAFDGSSDVSTRDVTGGLPFGLFVGRLEPRKNLKLALEALRLVPDETARLVVVGRNDFEDRNTLKMLEGERRAIHVQDVPDSVLRALYRDAAALLYPSLGEGWGLPILESLAAGTPVVASNVTAIPEAGGEVCHYFSPSAIDAAQSLADLFESALKGRLAFDTRAAAVHVSSLSWDHAAQQFVNVLRFASSRDHGGH